MYWIVGSYYVNRKLKGRLYFTESTLKEEIRRCDTVAGYKVKILSLLSIETKFFGSKSKKITYVYFLCSGNKECIFFSYSKNISVLMQ